MLGFWYLLIVKNFYDFTLPELEGYMLGLGEKKFRARQLFKWVYSQKETDPEKMLNLSKDFRAKIPTMFSFKLPDLITHQKSVDGTEKYLFEIEGGHRIEAVIIPSADRRTLCVSSEVGCNMACKFCFTAKQKLKRRLTAGEIVGQFLKAQEIIGDEYKITNIVYMGMGEPLDNPEAVFNSIEIFHDQLGLNLSKKRITVSTSGIVPQIPKVTKSGARLAVSLNAVNDDVRSEIMPINKRWPIAELLKVCKDYTDEVKDIVTFEYVLLKGITDSKQDAKDLHKLTRNIPCKINIIPFNEHPNSGYERPSEKSIVDFQKELMNLGSHTLRRRTMGRDISAACGQLTTKK